MKLSGRLDMIHTETTYKRIVKDALFFMNESRKSNIISEKNRYARITILLMAFYIESLSKLLFETLTDQPLKALDKRTDLGESIQRFRAVHNLLYQTELSLCTDGIKDIFTIRNRIFAHPKGLSKEKHSEVKPSIWKRSRVDIKVEYKKFKNFPTIYSQFTPSHAEDILKEVKNFLIKFHKVIKRKVLEKKILGPLWPRELIQYFTNLKDNS